MVIIRNIGLILLGFMVFSCNSTRVVRPLDKGEKQISADLGGPGIIYAGAPIPIPLSSISYAHGIDSNITMGVGLHTTSLAFGVLQSDVSFAWRAFESQSKQFGITATPGVHFLYDFHESKFRSYPQLDATAWWRYHADKEHLIYGGTGTWIELFKQKAHGQPQQNTFMPWITIGHQLNLDHWSYGVELKYLGFQHETAPSVVDFVSPAGRGTLGLYLGISRRLSK